MLTRKNIKQTIKNHSPSSETHLELLFVEDNSVDETEKIESKIRTFPKCSMFSELMTQTLAQ